MIHHCHALGCKHACPPKWLMCPSCWSQVPRDLQDQVYRTVGLRNRTINRSWAPWWRAAHRAIAHVAYLREPDKARHDAYLAKEMAFADRLEKL
jgi:hypothetical protein